MQKKLSKQFIYNWLSEDAYGEYVLHHPRALFSAKLLSNVWDYMLQRRASQKANLIPNVLLPRYAEFISLSLRLNSLVAPAQAFGNMFLSNSYSLRTYNFIKASFSQHHSPAPYSEKPGVPEHTRYLLGASTLKQYKHQLFLKRRDKKLRSLDFSFNARPQHNNITKGRKPYASHTVSSENKMKFIGNSTLNNFSPYSQTCPAILTKFNSFWRRAPQFITTLPSCRVIQQNLIFSTVWDALTNKLKVKIKRFEKNRPLTFASPTASSAIRLQFRVGSPHRRSYVVKKNEILTLLKFRLLFYYNVASNFLEFKRFALQSKVADHKQRCVPFSLEFYFVALLIRSGFFENGYVVNSLLKRGVFLLNGARVFCNAPTRIWDVCSVSKELWWLLYARFKNFFYGLRGLTRGPSDISPKNYLRRFLKFRMLFKKFSLNARGLDKLRFSRFLNSKNFILALPPAYIEVSYKLFVFVVHKIMSPSTDTAAFINLRGLKSMLPTFNPRI